MDPIFSGRIRRITLEDSIIGIEKRHLLVPGAGKGNGVSVGVGVTSGAEFVGDNSVSAAAAAGSDSDVTNLDRGLLKGEKEGKVRV